MWKSLSRRPSFNFLMILALFVSWWPWGLLSGGYQRSESPASDVGGALDSSDQSRLNVFLGQDSPRTDEGRGFFALGLAKAIFLSENEGEDTDRVEPAVTRFFCFRQSSFRPCSLVEHPSFFRRSFQDLFLFFCSLLL